MQRPQFSTNEIYHIYNRGVEKRNIFSNEKDYFRFIHDMFEFNDSAPAMNINFHFRSNPHPAIPRAGKKQRKIFVEIICFCLMPNHYHLLVKQKVDGGITEFMRKLGTGYTNYFNKKNHRVGSLFQGKFKAIHIKKDAHLLYLPHYIHLNPLDVAMPEWRGGKIRDVGKALQFLESYRWSSYQDYINKKNFPSITRRDFLHQIYGSPTSIDYYESEIRGWLSGMDSETIQDVVIEHD